MCKRLCLFFIFAIAVSALRSQYQSYQAKGELGLNVGTSHYFGDINPEAGLRPVHYAAGLYYQKYFNNYIGAKLAFNYVHLQADDADNTNAAYKNRNLNFTNNLAEVSLSASFNFFNFAPGNAGHNFTPYISLGAGAVYTNPFTKDNNDTKVFLRPLGTEGQRSDLPHSGKKYGAFAFVAPLSVGVKQAVSSKINIFAEVGYRFTNTDYLDDVSSTYAGTDAFSPGNFKGSAEKAALAGSLQDRSVGQSFGKKGWQRGNSIANDSYLLIQAGISYNFGKCNCPLVF